MKRMRGKTLVALTILSLTALSGCLGFGDETTEDDHGDECDGLEGDAHDACHDGEDTHGNETDNQTVTPNVPPVAKLTLTDADGNGLDNTTAIQVGQTITFSANGSMDSDGSLELAALTVVDSNGTRTMSLIQGGALTAVTLTFDTQGTVIAVLRVLDNDGDSASTFNITYVNQVQTKTGELRLPAPSVGVGDCSGPGGDQGSSVLDSSYSSAETFTVPNGTVWISAKTSDSITFNICSPDGEKISEGARGQDVSTPPGSYNGVGYIVFVTATGANASYTIEIVPHFEPKPEA